MFPSIWKKKSTVHVLNPNSAPIRKKSELGSKNSRSILKSKYQLSKKIDGKEYSANIKEIKVSQKNPPYNFISNNSYLEKGTTSLEYESSLKKKTSNQRLEQNRPLNLEKKNLSSSKNSLCCDKCDGKHETENCPYYKKKREDHPDAQRKPGKQIGGTSPLPGSIIRNARVVRQPGDGSCLFHSMSYGLKNGTNASNLRAEICKFIKNNPDLLISETPLKDWVKWDAGTSVTEYSRHMMRGSWGGGIEMACTSQLKNCNVHVYERNGIGFKRISAFDHPENCEKKPIIRVLYCGGVHYDALIAS